jgi:hypothetical protein
LVVAVDGFGGDAFILIDLVENHGVVPLELLTTLSDHFKRILVEKHQLFFVPARVQMAAHAVPISAVLLAQLAKVLAPTHLPFFHLSDKPLFQALLLHQGQFHFS